MKVKTRVEISNDLFKNATVVNGLGEGEFYGLAIEMEDGPDHTVDAEDGIPGVLVFIPGISLDELDTEEN